MKLKDDSLKFLTLNNVVSSILLSNNAYNLCRMNKRKSFQKKYTSFMYNHLWLKWIIDYGFAFIMSVISAAIFAFGIVCFMKPGVEGIPDLVSGGSSGLAQTVALALEMCGINIENHHNLLFSICYIAINMPLIVLAFFGIGKR